MNFASCFLTLSIIPLSASAANIASTFVRHYFQFNRIRQVVIFACWDEARAEKMKFFERDTRMEMMTAYVDVRQDNIELKSIMAVNYYRIGVVLDLECPERVELFGKLARDQLPFNESYYWLVLHSGRQIETAKTMLENLPLTVSSEMTLALQGNNNYLLYDIYNPSYRNGGKLNVTFIGSWNDEEGLSIGLRQYKFKRRQDLHGLVLNFSIVLNHPTLPDYDTYLTTPIKPHLDSLIRFHYALILQLKDFYNFTIHMTRAKTWGYKTGNGTFNGILGDMINGIVDISAAPFRFKQERMDFCEYTVQTYVARPCFIFRHPKKNELRNVFLKPFEEKVWWMILLAAIVYWLLLLLTVKIEIRYKASEKLTCSLVGNPTSETALITTASICQQGLSDTPRLYSGRIVYISLFLWGLLLFQFYSASIVGFLLSEPPRFINNIKDILDSSLEVGIEDIDYNRDYLTQTTDPVAIELNERKVKPNKKRKVSQYFSAAEGLKKARLGGFAFHVDIATAYKIIEDTFDQDEICDLAEVQLFPPRHIGMITSKRSPFKKMVVYGLRQIMEHGMTNRLRDVWHARRPRCPESHSSIPVPVALKEFSPALFSLLFGIGIAVCMVLIEILIENWTCSTSKH